MNKKGAKPDKKRKVIDIVREKHQQKQKTKNNFKPQGGKPQGKGGKNKRPGKA
jgi:hypothetical protein